MSDNIMTLWAYWRNGIKNTEVYPGAPKGLWPLQLLQHTLSLFSHLPIRILDNTGSAQKHDGYDTPPNCKLDSFPDWNVQDWISQHEDWIERYNDRKQLPWLTLRCNSLPVHEYLRRNRLWIAWENWSFTNWLIGIRNNPEDNKNCCDEHQTPDAPLNVTHFVTDGMLLSAYPLKLENSEDDKLYAIIGPTFVRPVKQIAAEKWFEKSVTSFVDKVSESFSRGADKVDYKGAVNLGQFPEDYMLKLRSGARGFIGESCFLRQSILIGETIQTLLNMKLDAEFTREKSPRIIRNTAYNSLARAAILLKKLEEEYLSFSDDYKQVSKVQINIDHRLETAAVVEADRSNDKWDLNLKPQETGDPNGQKRDVIIELESDLEKIQDHLNRKWEDMALANVSHAHVYNADNLANLSSWLSREFDRVPQNDREILDDRILKNMCRRIMHLLLADTVTIFRVDYSSDAKKPILVPMRIYYQDSLPRDDRDFGIEVERVLMKRIGKLPTEDQKKSISYRAYLQKMSFLSRNWNNETNEGNNQDQSIANPLDDDCNDALQNLKDKPPNRREKYNGNGRPKTFIAKSALAVPLIIHGHVFGVLEACGFDGHQFRFLSLVMAERIANLIAPFLYQRKMLRRLFKLNTEVTDPSLTNSEKYAKVCEAVTRIFLAEASILFIPNPDDWNKFDLVARYNLDKYEEFNKTELPITVCDEDFEYPADKRGYVEEDDLKMPFETYSVNDKYRRPNGDEKIALDESPWTKGSAGGPSEDKQHKMIHRRAIAMQFSPLVEDNDKIADDREDGKAMIIRVRNRRGGMILCRISLYYPVYENNVPEFNQEWNSTIMFVSYYLTSILMTIRAFQPLNSLLEKSGAFELIEEDLKGRKTGQEINDRNENYIAIIGEHIKALHNGYREDTHKRDYLNYAESLVVPASESNLVMVLGSGASIPYGVPDWKLLIQQFVMKRIHDDRYLKWADDFAPHVFYHTLMDKSPLISATHIRQRYPSDDKFIDAIRSVIYSKVKIPKTEESSNNSFGDNYYMAIAELQKALIEKKCSLDSIINYNYDSILEQIMDNKEIHKFAITGYPGENHRRAGQGTSSGVPIYYVHGSLPHNDCKRRTSELVGNPNQAKPVLAEETYHQQYSEPYKWNSLIQIRKFVDKTCLFIGHSFADPNLRRLLDTAAMSDPSNLKSPDQSPKHVALLKRMGAEDKLKIKYAIEGTLLRVLGSGHKKTGRQILNAKEKKDIERFDRSVNTILDDLCAFLERSEDELFGKLNVNVARYDEHPQIMEFINKITSGVQNGS